MAMKKSESVKIILIIITTVILALFIIWHKSIEFESLLNFAKPFMEEKCLRLHANDQRCLNMSYNPARFRDLGRTNWIIYATFPDDSKQVSLSIGGNARDGFYVID